MEYDKLRFSRKEARKILRLALNKQYDASSQQELEMEFSELVEDAQEGGISEDNLKGAITEHRERNSRRRGRLKGLAATIAIATGLGLAGTGVHSLATRESPQLEYVDAIVSERNGREFILTIENQEADYLVKSITCGSLWSCKRKDALYDLLRQGSQIRVNKEKLEEFDDPLGQIRYYGRLRQSDIILDQR